MKHIVFLAIACSLTSGCSLAFSRPPDRARPLPLCQPNLAPPVIDTSEAVGGGILALWMLGHASNEMYSSESDTFAVLGLITAGVSAAWGLSAHYGFKQARACRELRNEIAQTPHPPLWIAPSVPPEQRPGVEVPIPEVEQHVDVDEDQIDIHTTIRRAKPRPQ